MVTRLLAILFCPCTTATSLVKRLFTTESDTSLHQSEEEQSLLRHEEEEEYPVDEGISDQTRTSKSIIGEESSNLTEEQVDDLVQSQLKSFQEFSEGDAFHEGHVQYTEKVLLGLEEGSTQDIDLFSFPGNNAIQGDPAKTLKKLEEDVTRELSVGNPHDLQDNPFDTTPFATPA